MEGDPGYQDISDEQLILLFKDSDGAAFTAIFKRYRSILLLYSYRRTSDLEKSKDILRDAFMELWENRSDLQISEELRPFLITVVKNKIAAYADRQKYLSNT